MNWKKHCSYCCCGTTPVLVIAAVACVFISAVLVLAVPTVVTQQVNERVTLVPGHTTYEQFLNPELPVWKSIYFFNLTNPEGFVAGEKPVLEEKGPYGYREYRIKTPVNISNDNPDILIYTQERTFHFDPDKSASGVTEEDVICTVNLALVGAVAETLKLTPSLKKEGGINLLKVLISNKGAKLYICAGASSLVWNYTDPFIQELYGNSVLNTLGMNLPNPYIEIQQNNSINDSRPSTVYTGAGNINNIGKFYKWNGHVGELDTWPNGMGANVINGTEGLVFHPNQKENETLESFQSDVLRSFQMVYVGKVKHLDLEAYRYELPNSTFESAFNNSENARWGSWCPDGMIYLGPTQNPEVPVFGSKPHFLDGSPSLREAVTGLNPDPSRNRSAYDTVLDVQPVIGANLQFRISLQLNLQVNQTDSFMELQNINGTLYYPVLYIVEFADLTEGFKDIILKGGLSLIQTVGTLQWVFFALLLLGVVLCITFAVVSCVLCVLFSKEPKSEGFIEKESKKSSHYV